MTGKTTMKYTTSAIRTNEMMAWIRSPTGNVIPAALTLRLETSAFPPRALMIGFRMSLTIA